MAEPSSNSAPEVPANCRTVLLALRSEIDILKSSIYEVADRAGWSVLDLRYSDMKVPRPGRRTSGVPFCP